MTLDEILAMPPGDKAFEAMRAYMHNVDDAARKAMLADRRYYEWLRDNVEAIMEWSRRTSQ